MSGALKKAGIELDLKNEAAYKAGLRDIASTTRMLGLESKIAMERLGKNATPTQRYRAALGGLGKELEYSTRRTKIYGDALGRLPETQKLLKEDIDKTTQAWKDQSKHTKKLGQEYKDLMNERDRIATSAQAQRIAYQESSKETEHLRKQVRKLKDEHSPLHDALKTSEERTKKLNDEYVNLKKREGELGSSIRNTREEFERSSESTKKLEENMTRLTRQHDINAEKFKTLAVLQKESQYEEAKLIREMSNIHDQWRDSGGIFATQAAALDRWGGKLKNIGRGMIDTGEMMTQYLTVPIVTGFGAATMSAINFNSEIQQLGPLMAEGGEITVTMKNEMKQLGKASRQWAIDYGKSTSEINSSLAEFVRTGFKANDTMKMMPHVLDASVASGENFNDVMSTGIEGFMQFGFQAGNVSEGMQRVMDSYTHVANATKSGITDIGMAMGYVGSAANGLGMSIEETAASIGILTNRGIDASMAGTGLRAVLSSLANPTDKAASAMDQLGISYEAFKNGQIGLTDIIDSVAKSTKHLTDEQRTALLMQGFGRVGANAMNALYQEGADRLRTLTEETKNATGETKRMADQMRETPKFKFDQAVAQVKDLGISIGQQLMPRVLEMIDGAGKWVDKFNRLDSKTKDMVINTGLLTAAIGPLLIAGGAIVSGTGNILKGLSGITRGVGKLLTPVSRLLGYSSTASMALGGLKSALALMTGPAGIAVGAIAGVYGAFKLLAEDAIEAQQAMADWPSIDGITAEQAGSIDEVSGAYQDLESKLKTLKGSTAEYADEVSRSIGKITEEIKKLNDQKFSEMEEKISKLPVAYQQAARDMIAEEKRQGEMLVSWAQSYEDATSNIVQRAVEENRDLTNRENAMIQQLGRQSVATFATVAGETQEQQSQIYKALTADVSKASRKQLANISESAKIHLQNSFEEFKTYRDSMAEVFGTDRVAYENWNKSVMEKFDQSVSQYAAARIKHAKDTGQSLDNLGTDIANTLGMIDNEFRELGYTPEKVMDLGMKNLNASRVMLDDFIDDISVSSARAGKAIVDTNLALEPILKNMGMSLKDLTNGSKADLEEFARQAQEAGLTWDDMRYIINEAIKGNIDLESEEFFKKLDEADTAWEKDWETKNAKIEADYTELVKAFDTIEEYNALEPAEKYASVLTKGNDEIKELLDSMGLWDDGKHTDIKERILKNEVTGAERVQWLMYFLNQYEDFDPETKELMVRTSTATLGLDELIDKLHLFENQDFVNEVQMNVDTNAPEAKQQVMDLINQFLAADGQQATVHLAEDGSVLLNGTLDNINLKLENIDGTTSKVILDGDTSGLMGDIDEAVGSLGQIPDSKETKLGLSVMDVIGGMLAGAYLSTYKKNIEEIPDSKTTEINANSNGLSEANSDIEKYNTETGNMKDKTVSVNTNIPNLGANITKVKDWNDRTGKMKDHSSNAKTTVPNMAGNTTKVDQWNTKTGNMADKSSTATTQTPGIAANISSVATWIGKLDRAYNKTSTLTTVHHQVYKTSKVGGFFGGLFAEGGHIGAFANGGNIQWGGMFARGARVPNNYAGIVGEAGPELFRVTRSGVTITPLSSNEKMRGIEGAISDYMKNKNNGDGKGVNININIDGPTFRDETDMDKLTKKVSEALSRELRRQQITMKGSAVGV